MPVDPDIAYMIVAPDRVRKGISLGTRRLHLHEERPVYAHEGVPPLWLVDPLARSLEAFEIHDGQWLPIASAKDNEPVDTRPFDAVTFSLGISDPDRHMQVPTRTFRRPIRDRGIALCRAWNWTGLIGLRLNRFAIIRIMPITGKRSR